MTLGERVKHLRELRRMTQVELAKRAGLARSYIVLLEQGTRDNPTLNVLHKVAQGLGVGLGMLVDETERQ